MNVKYISINQCKCTVQARMCTHPMFSHCPIQYQMQLIREMRLSQNHSCCLLTCGFLFFGLFITILVFQYVIYSISRLHRSDYIGDLWPEMFLIEWQFFNILSCSFGYAIISDYLIVIHKLFIIYYYFLLFIDNLKSTQHLTESLSLTSSLFQSLHVHGCCLLGYDNIYICICIWGLIHYSYSIIN